MATDFTQDGIENSVPSTDDLLLAELVRLVLRRVGADGWAELNDGFWLSVQPPDYQLRAQGWKLHVSATPLSAALVTVRAAEVLVGAGCAFKVAIGLPQLLELISVNCDRGSAGKVITAYPRDDEQFVQLAERLHRAIEHLPGPAILSDRPYRPGSLVHARFGAFTGHTVLSNDGAYESMLRTPDGSLVNDERLAWFSPPRWAPYPLDGNQGTRPSTPTAGPVLLADRFVVRQAIRHGTKGGVYLGLDQTTGQDVVIKQARAHIGAMLDGTDARDLLRHEAALLQRLAPYDFTAPPVSLFEQDGHLFLAQDQITGSTLFDWVAQRGADDEAPGEQAAVPLGEVCPIAEQLLALITTMHAEGLVLRDLSPTNLMVTPSGELKLIDLEHVAVPGNPVAVIGTPGYAAPEQVHPPRQPYLTGIAPAPDQTADLYSLGALLFFLTSRVDPALAPDRPAHRPLHQRLAHLVRLVAASSPATRALGPAIVGLLADDPDNRWSLDRVRDFLATQHRPASPGPVAMLPEPDRLSSRGQDALLADGLAFLVETMSDPTGDRLWSGPEPDSDHDPRNVQRGAGGVLAVLTRAAAAFDDDRLGQAVQTVATWLDQRLSTGDRLLSGLYFGCSGALWALSDAATFLGDEKLAQHAHSLAKTIPVQWPNPDICHGAAGAGMAQLHLWHTSGDEEFGARVRACADGLLAAVTWRDKHALWPIPVGFDSALAGMTHYGFAHGVAGIGAFLLAAGQATGDDRYLAMADAAGETLCAIARRDGPAAWWPTGEEKDPTQATRMPHWCSGSSGVGTFLARLWQATGHEQSRELAEAAAYAVRGARWQMTTAVCHGLAGDGEFLLDMADLLGDQRYHVWAEELAACLDARSVMRNGYLLVPDESGSDISAGYGTGLAGVLSFLLRLRHGGPRPWMVDVGAHQGVRRALRSAADGTGR